MEMLRPDVYIQEIKGAPPLEGVSTATAGFVGVATKGEVGKAVLVTSWQDFTRKYGGLMASSQLGYAVKGFFENGGSRAYISRVVKYTTGAPTSVKAKKVFVDGSAAQVLQIEARTDGAWGNSIYVTLSNVNVTDKTYDLTVELDGNISVYEAVAHATADDFFADHETIKVIVIDDTKLPVAAARAALATGADGLVGITDADYIGDGSVDNGLYAFDGISVNLIAVPGVTTVAVHQGIITYAEARKDCFGLLDPPFGSDPSEIATYKSSNSIVSEYAAMYYPFLKVNDPLGVGASPSRFVPPSGHVIGCIARIDNTRGVWKAPAGVEGKINGIVGVEYVVNSGEHDILNPAGINVIKAVDDNGICIWGTRTLSKGEYKYVPVRRLMIYLATTLKKNMPWVVFEPNNEALWGKIRTSVEAFLTGIWKAGGLKGESMKDAFFVACDGTINTKDVIDQGIVYVDIGIAAVKPAEFVVFRLSLK